MVTGFELRGLHISQQAANRDVYNVHCLSIDNGVLLLLLIFCLPLHKYAACIILEAVVFNITRSMQFACMHADNKEILSSQEPKSNVCLCVLTG